METLKSFRNFTGYEEEDMNEAIDRGIEEAKKHYASWNPIIKIVERYKTIQ